MKTVLTVLALLGGLAACSGRGQESARVGESSDTTVTTRQTQDTTIVNRDTTVRVDTNKKEGEVKRDTAKH